MLSPSTQFTRNKNRDDAPCHVVVKLTDGVTTWYFSDREMQFGATHIYPMLSDLNDIRRESLDIFTKKWAVGSMTVELSNAPYRKSGATAIRPSEDLAWIQGNEVSVYLLCGYDVTTFPDDLLLIFKGDIIEPIEVSAESVRITVRDKSYKLDLKLPNTIISNIYSTAPNDTKNKKIPIVYGKFNIAGDLDEEFNYTGDGLAVGIAVDDATVGPKCVFADHVIKAITNIWLKHEQVADPCIYLSGLTLDGLTPTDVVVDNDDSGRATGTPTRVARAFLYMNGNECDWSYAAYADSTVNYENIWDRDENTYASVLDFDDDGLWDYQMGNAFISLDPAYVALLTNLINSTAKVIYEFKLNGKFQDMLPGGADGRSVFGIWAFSASTDWQTSNALTPASRSYYFIQFAKGSSGAGDGIPNNYVCGRIYCFRVILEFMPQVHRNIFAEVEGMEYGSWITGRSSNYADGDCIEDPAGIIESMLRTYLGLTDASIDLPSFIAAENTAVKARLNIHDGNSKNVTDFIRQLAEQSTFAYFFGANGKAKLIPLNDEDPVAVRTIKWNDIIDGNINITKSEHWIKQLNYYSRYQQEYGNIYRDYAELSNASSGSNECWEAKWPNICGTSAIHVANHLIKKADGTGLINDNGIWANQHNIIEFATPYFQNADLEIGDNISIDHNAADLHLKCLDESWEGKVFMVIGIEQSIDKTLITAIELFTDII